jgi:hypothetical protein
MTARRVYDTREHRQLRAKYKRAVDAGNAWCLEPICLMPDRHIEPGQKWDLAHDEFGDYRGPAHAKCNRSEAARRGNVLRSRNWRNYRQW